MEKNNLNTNWKTAYTKTECKLTDIPNDAWKVVTVPHNWEDYHGYRNVSHGNLHGSAWYVREVELENHYADQQVMLLFEGVGSYATVYVDGAEAGSHAGGRTCFYVDITPHVLGKNSVTLSVRADHPEEIDDLPFVCGGCWGSPNTEGSQPFGLHRRVSLQYTGAVRIDPFETHVWCPEVGDESSQVEVDTIIRNGADAAQNIMVTYELKAPHGPIVAAMEKQYSLDAAQTREVKELFPRLEAPELWSPENPALYELTTTIRVDGVTTFEESNTFGIRSYTWPRILSPDADLNVSSMADKKILDIGSCEITPGNNGHTEILSQSPVQSIMTNRCGVKIYGDSVTAESAQLRLELELVNVSDEAQTVACHGEILNDGGTVFYYIWNKEVSLEAGAQTTLTIEPDLIRYPHIWKSNDPYLHKFVLSLSTLDGDSIEVSSTTFGIEKKKSTLNRARPVFEEEEGESKPESDVNQTAEDLRFKINGAPFFHNGEAEYENLLGQDHAFSDEQIDAEMEMFLAAGFNAFRDAHHPHNLKYYEILDKKGIPCWTQMGTHIYFDNDRFRENYRQCVIEWVKERRNSPSICIWGLQNESTLPEEFARELTQIITCLDPTSGRDRITTTCNGGKGSHWNVPQEWKGTYGGNCNDYAIKEFQLVGEYGTWRHLGNHSELAYHGDENDNTESYCCYLHEAKIRVAEEVRDEVIGHYHWILSSFPNPGRSVDAQEGKGNMAIGSINHKGLFTTWRQPADLYYLFRSNYADANTDPMVYIVSHTWPDRWKKETKPKKIDVYSNCDEVELFNGSRSLGKIKNPGRGRHFIFEDIDIQEQLIHAKGYLKSTVVATDAIVCHGLKASDLLSYKGEDTNLIAGADQNVVFRVNCGSLEDYTDSDGATWQADVNTAGQKWLSKSWGEQFEEVADDIASRSESMEPVRKCGLNDTLFHTHRYGREFLAYEFDVENGNYEVELFFAETWYGIGGGNCQGWRLFDVAINGNVVEENLDIWNEAGTNQVLKRSYPVFVDTNKIRIHFPKVLVNQATISAIRITKK